MPRNKFLDTPSTSESPEMSLELFPSICWCPRWPELSHFQETASSIPIHELLDTQSKNTQSSKKNERKHKQDEDESSTSSLDLDMDNYDNEPDAPCFSHSVFLFPFSLLCPVLAGLSGVILPEDDEYQTGEVSYQHYLFLFPSSLSDR